MEIEKAIVGRRAGALRSWLDWQRRLFPGVSESVFLENLQVSKRHQECRRKFSRMKNEARRKRLRNLLGKTGQETK